MKLMDWFLERIKGAYGLRVGATAIMIAGAFLLIEHRYFHGIDITFGHEHVGMILIAISIVLGYISKNKIK